MDKSPLSANSHVKFEGAQRLPKSPRVFRALARALAFKRFIVLFAGIRCTARASDADFRARTFWHKKWRYARHWQVWILGGQCP